MDRKRTVYSFLVNRWTIILYSALIGAGLYAASFYAGGRLSEMVFQRGLIPHLIVIASAIALGLLFRKFMHTRLSKRNLSKLTSFFHTHLDQISAFMEKDQPTPDEQDSAIVFFDDLPSGRERDRIVGLLKDAKEASQDFALKRFEILMDLEAQATEDSYKIPQVLAWTVPMLGFLGTVWGIALSLGNFTGVMGDVDNISQIKEGLGTITAGLGIAFDTTLLGLFFAIVITGFTTILQRMESSGLDLMERTALDVLKTVSAINVPLATERTADHMTSATVELRLALADLKEYVADLKNIADGQRENLSEERRALEVAAESLQNLGKFSDSIDHFSEAGRELRRAVGVLEAPREFRLVERKSSGYESDQDE